MSHCVANSSLFLWSCPAIITRLDFSAGTYQLVELKALYGAVAAEWQQPLSPQNFVDSCILAGWGTHSPTFNPIHQKPDSPPGSPPVFDIRNVFRAVSQFKGGFSVLQYFGTMQGSGVDTKTIEQFLKHRTLVRNHLVLDPSGTCLPLCLNPCPNDLHEVLPLPLPVLDPD